jgi:hypothetical protein
MGIAREVLLAIPFGYGQQLLSFVGLAENGDGRCREGAALAATPSPATRRGCAPNAGHLHQHRQRNRSTCRAGPLASDLKDGEAQLVRITGKGNMDRWIEKILAAAGVEVWERFWQTLRASCEIEWAQKFPQFAVSRWIGHSITVSGKHYANMVPDELFDRAAQNAARQPAAMAGNAPKADGSKNEKPQSDATSRNRQLELTGGGGNRTRVP